MDWGLTEEQVAVRDLAREILDDGGGWAELAQAGLLSVAMPDVVGFVGAHLILEQVGAHASLVPYWSTIVLGALPLAQFGGDAHRDLLDPVLAGEAHLTAALSGRFRAQGDRLTGVATTVPWPHGVTHVLVPAAADVGDEGLWLLDAAALEARDQPVISEAPHAELVVEAVPGEHLGGPDAVRWLTERARAGLASMQAGLCASALRLAADYTGRREQFGRPVASFQAVGHRLADAFIDTEGVTLTALQAAWRLSEGLPASDEVAIAAWWAAEAGHHVLHAAQHVHGGIGVDRDYPLHRYFLLTKQLEFALGGATTHLRAVGQALAEEPV